MKCFLLVPLILCGCALSKDIATIPHADGNGYTRYKYIAAGGIIRPGVILVVSESVSTNGTNMTTPPSVLTQASGPPVVGGVANTLGLVGAAATLGATLPDHSDNNSSTTTLIRDEPLSPPVPPQPRPPRPPWGPPTGRPRTSPHNGGH